MQLKIVRLLLISLLLLLISAELNAQWRQAVPVKSDFTSLTTGGNIIYAGTYSGELFASFDNGASWSFVQTLLAGYRITALVFYQQDLIAGTDSGLYRSADGGITWSNLNLGTGKILIRALVVTGGRIFAATFGHGLLLSVDGGNTWSTVTNGLDGYLFLTTVSQAGDKLFLYSIDSQWPFSNRGVYISDLSGESWSRLESWDSHYGEVHYFTLAGNNILAGSSEGIYRSENGGTTWVKSSPGTGTSYFFSMAVEGTKVITSGWEGTYESLDAGVSWAPNILGTQQIIAFGGTPGVIAGGSFEGMMFVSYNSGSSWNVDTLGVSGSVQSLASDETVILGASADRIIRSATNEFTWEDAGMHSKTITDIVASNGLIFAGAYDNGVFVSPNHGNSWEQRINGLTNLQATSLAASDANMYLGTENRGVFQTTNKGINWVSIGPEYGYAGSMANIDNHLFIGSPQMGVYHTSNNGTNWLPENNSLGDSCVNDLTIHAGYLFAGTCYGGIYRSQLESSQWTAVNTGFSNTMVNCFTNAGNQLFAGTEGGVFLTNNAGAQWHDIIYGLRDLSITALAVHENNIFAGTRHNGIWVRPLSQLLTVDAIPENPSFFVYPNPARDFVIIRGPDQIDGRSNISLFDIAGRKVVKDMNQVTLPCQLMVGALQRGLYFIRLNSGGQVLILKLILS